MRGNVCLPKGCASRNKRLRLQNGEVVFQEPCNIVQGQRSDDVDGRAARVQKQTRPGDDVRITTEADGIEDVFLALGGVQLKTREHDLRVHLAGHRVRW
jgi:hypothetical protein